MKKILYLMCIVVIIILSCFLFACKNVEIAEGNNEETEQIEEVEPTYSIKYKGVVNDKIVWEDVVFEKQSSKINYTAKYVVGYAFDKWDDGGVNEGREDDLSSQNKEFIASYKKELLELPVMNIYTSNNAKILDKENYVDCKISIENTLEEYCIENEIAGIRGRGNSTWNVEKKPYRIKFDKKQSLFGTEYKQKSWVLLANFYDKSLVRNSIAYEMAEQFEDIQFSSIHEFIDVYLNDEYIGVYLLCDQMQTGKGRVDIDESFDVSGDVGYFIEMDSRAEGEENDDYFDFEESRYALKTPDTEDKDYDSAIYITFIKGYFTQCKEAFSMGWQEVNELIDVDSFADTYIIYELFANPDSHFTSFYLYKDKSGKLFAGPIWDFDLGGGNHENQIEMYDETEGECLPNSVLWTNKNYWYKNLLEYDEFKSIIKGKLVNYNDTINNIISVLDSTNVNGYYEMYKKSLKRNFDKWQILGCYTWPNTPKVAKIDTLKGQMEYLRIWLLGRLEFIKSIYCSET